MTRRISLRPRAENNSARGRYLIIERKRGPRAESLQLEVVYYGIEPNPALARDNGDIELNSFQLEIVILGLELSQTSS
ncbi:hypothetical protein PGT21_001031 [Puccinia graminis f. sp. tritici]|uniref:Uncharacterized protein n=1 Tax=Puccinia graminis f. sp. tritici TaxID=56615 RepID=A0A5B0PIY8_PUCGR|nr:hypothetical protein PGT21_001031 [Puccinia graminis f. sp. tritici]